MKKITYPFKTVILLTWVPIVIMLFKVVSDRQIAAVVAGAGFIFLPTFVLLHEVFEKNLRSKIIITVCVQFLIFFAWPIFLLRVLNWGVPFQEVVFLGLSPTTLHKYSNVSYMLMVVTLGVKSLAEWCNKKRQPLG